jgi:hypothetical protein
MSKSILHRYIPKPGEAYEGHFNISMITAILADKFTLIKALVNNHTKS